MIRAILKESFFLVLKYRILWFFGLILFFVVVNNEFDYLFNTFSTLSKGDFSSYFWNFFLEKKTIIKTIFAILISLPIFSLLIFSSVISQSFLILAIKKIFFQKETISFGKLLASSKKYFWNVLKIGLLFKLIILVVWLVLVFFLIKFKSTPSLFLYLIVFLFYIPGAMILTFFSNYIFRYLIIEKNDFENSFKRGIKLFFSNWQRTLIMSFSLLIFNFILSFLFGLLVFLVIAFPFLLIIFLYGLISGVDLSFFTLALRALFEMNFWAVYQILHSINLGSSILTNIVGFLILVLIFIFSGVLISFQNIAWTLFFFKLTQPKTSTDLTLNSQSETESKN